MLDGILIATLYGIQVLTFVTFYYHRKAINHLVMAVGYNTDTIVDTRTNLIPEVVRIVNEGQQMQMFDASEYDTTPTKEAPDGK